MSQCDVQDLADDAKCLFGVSLPGQADAIELALLCRILKSLNPQASCDVQLLADRSKCFLGVAMGGQYEALYMQLLCQIKDNIGTVSPVLREFFYYSMESVEGTAPNDYITNLASSDSNTNLFLNGGSVTDPPAAGPGVEIVTGFIGNGALSHANHFWNGQISVTRTQIVDGVPATSYDLLKLGGRDWTTRYWIKNASAAPVNSSETATHIWGVRFFGAAEPGEPDPYQILVRKRNQDVFGENYYELRMGPFSDPAQLQLFSAVIDAGTVWTNWHRVVMTFEASSGTASIQINNDSPVSVSVPGFNFGISSHRLELLSYMGNTAFMNYTMDEFLFLPDVVWDADDSTYDWNGGSGRTFPDLP